MQEEGASFNLTSVTATLWSICQPLWPGKSVGQKIIF